MLKQDFSSDNPSPTDTEKVGFNLCRISDERLDYVLADCVAMAHRNGPKYMRTSCIFNTLWGRTYDPSILDELTTSICSLRPDADLNWHAIFVVSDAGVYWVCKGYHRLSAVRRVEQSFISVFVVHMPTSVEPRLPSRVQARLHRIVQRLEDNLNSKTLIAQCVSIKRVCDEIRIEKVSRNTKSKSKRSEKLTLREVAIRMFPNWPNNLGTPDVSILLMPSRSTVETYWKNITPLLRGNRALQRLHSWERRGLINSWKKCDLATVGD